MPLHHSTAKSINQNKSKQKSPISKRILPHTLPQVYPRCCGCTARTAASHNSWASSGQAQGLAVPLTGSPAASLTAQCHRAPCHQSLPDENLSRLPTQGGKHHTQAPECSVQQVRPVAKCSFCPKVSASAPFQPLSSTRCTLLSHSVRYRAIIHCDTGSHFGVQVP